MLIAITGDLYNRFPMGKRNCINPTISSTIFQRTILEVDNVEDLVACMGDTEFYFSPNRGKVYLVDGKVIIDHFIRLV